MIWVGVAVLPLTLLAARGFATVERAQLPAVLDRPVPTPAYRRAAADASPVARADDAAAATRRRGWTRCTPSSGSPSRSSRSSSR